MDFAHDGRTEQLRGQLLEFMHGHVYPAEKVFHEQLAQLENKWACDSTPVIQELRAQARKRDLWNLFLPGDEGAGLSNLQYAVLAEISGRSGHLAPAAMNCAAPDTGNMEVLALFARLSRRRDGLSRCSKARSAPRSL